MAFAVGSNGSESLAKGRGGTRKVVLSDAPRGLFVTAIMHQGLVNQRCICMS